MLRSTPTLTTRSLSNDTEGPYTHIPCDVDRHICRNAILCRRSTRERDFRQDTARKCRRADLPRGRFGQTLHARTRFPADITMTTPEATLPQSHFFETLHARTPFLAPKDEAAAPPVKSGQIRRGSFFCRRSTRERDSGQKCQFHEGPTFGGKQRFEGSR